MNRKGNGDEVGAVGSHLRRGCLSSRRLSLYCKNCLTVTIGFWREQLRLFTQYQIDLVGSWLGLGALLVEWNVCSADASVAYGRCTREFIVYLVKVAVYGGGLLSWTLNNAGLFLSISALHRMLLLPRLLLKNIQLSWYGPGGLPAVTCQLSLVRHRNSPPDHTGRSLVSLSGPFINRRITVCIYPPIYMSDVSRFHGPGPCYMTCVKSRQEIPG